MKAQPSNGSNPMLGIYLKRLQSELDRRWITSERILDEARDHLMEAIEHGQASGLTDETACRQALERFGSAHQVAERFDHARKFTMQKILAVIALICGLFLAYVETRPKWDDMGILVGCLVLSAGILTMISPRRPWLWALLVGIWIPLAEIVIHHAYSVVITLIFPFFGAYLAWGVRKALALVNPKETMQK